MYLRYYEVLQCVDEVAQNLLPQVARVCAFLAVSLALIRERGV